MHCRVKHNYVLIIVLLICMLFSTFSYGEVIVKGVVVADSVNVRAEANLDSAIVKTLKIGQYADIIDANDEWYNVKLEDNLFGWVYSDLIVPLNQDTDISNSWIVNAENVNVREKPNLDSSVLFKLQKNSEVTINEKLPEWYNITFNNTSGWISSQFISPKFEYSKAEITGSNVNLRSVPSVEGSTVVGKLQLFNQVTIKNYQDGWYNIVNSEGVEGWVHQDFVSIINSARSVEVSRSSSRSATQLKIVDFAKKYLGTPYKWAGNGPTSFDCSGYTSFVFKHFGVTLPRRSVDQGKTGEKINKNNLTIGDLVFFDTSGVNNGNITHAGIYIGDGEFIHASSGSSAKKVVISSINEGYYNDKFVVARRVF